MPDVAVRHPSVPRWNVGVLCFPAGRVGSELGLRHNQRCS
jgi:hypothetical protein